MIKSIYFMFFVCACLFGLFACSAKAQDKFKNLSSDDFEKAEFNLQMQQNSD